VDTPVGRFVWFDYATHDAPKVQQFFAGLFGWSSMQMTLGARKYSLITVGDRHIGGYTESIPNTPIYRYSEPYGRWLPFLQIWNCHDGASRVKTLGGKMVKEPHPFGDIARMAIATDPAAIPFVLWQPSQPQDHSWQNAGPHTFCWAELYTDNTSSAVALMKQLAGFTEQKSQLADSPYIVLEKDGQARAGIRRPMGKAQPGWFPWVKVTNADAIVAKAQQLGADILVPATDTGANRMALIADPWGASLGILQPR